MKIGDSVKLNNNCCCTCFYCDSLRKNGGVIVKILDTRAMISINRTNLEYTFALVILKLVEPEIYTRISSKYNI